MSGWYYMKEGAISDSEIGPIETDAFLKLAFEGAIKLRTMVRHEKHTKGQWAYLEQIPAAKKKLEEGEYDREQKSEAAREAKQEAKRQLIAAKEETKKQQAEERRLSEVAQKAEYERQIRFAQEQPPRPPQPIAVMVHAHNPNYHQVQAGGWFTRAFGSTMGVMMALMFVILGIPILLCGGCLVIGIAGSASIPRDNKTGSTKTGTSQSSQSQPSTPTPQDPLASVKRNEFFQARDIYAAYEANELRGAQAFDDKAIPVTGTIKDVSSDILGTPFVALDVGNPLFCVQCMFPRDTKSTLANLNIGETVFIGGTGGGKLGNVIIKDCRFLKPAD